MAEHRSHYRFFIEATKILRGAQFVIDCLPNADPPSVDRAIAELNAVRTVLLHLDDSLTTPEEQADLVEDFHRLLISLETHKSSPTPLQPGRDKVFTGRRGRPRYQVDLERALELHGLGNSWEEISSVMGVDRKTIYRHLDAAGLATARPAYSDMEDDELDEKVASISREHPFVGSAIVCGHFEAMGIHLPILRVKESLKRVDAEAVLVRWSGIIRRHVYRVRGANALWHQDGNEKLRPWGFYVHGCIDGYARLIIYLECSSNKRAATVSSFFIHGVDTFGWPSRVRGDFGTENNDIERKMLARWGDRHRAYLRGRSIHNVWIERLWRDVRKDSLEAFRQVFFYLEECGLLDMNNIIHRVCLFLVYQPRIQASLVRTRDAWNYHRVRTAGNRTPVALFELSREKAIQQGYWTGDPGDAAGTASDPLYGCDGEAPMPPADEIREDPVHHGADIEMEEMAEKDAGVRVHAEDELEDGRHVLEGFDLHEEDGNWGMDVYCEAVLYMYAKVNPPAVET